MVNFNLLMISSNFGAMPKPSKEAFCGVSDADIDGSFCCLIHDFL